MGVDRIAFKHALTGDNDWSDREFLRLLAWRKSADRDLVQAAGAANVESFCRAVRARMVRCRPRRAGKRRTVARILQPLWSQFAWDDPPTARHLSNVLRDLHRRLEKHGRSRLKPSSAVAKLVAASLEQAPPEASPWAQLCWTTILIEAASLLDDPTLMRLWRRLLIESIPLSDFPPRANPPADGEFSDDRQLLISGELPWLSGLAFADLKGAAKVRRAGQHELCRQLEALTDGDGTPHARALHRLQLMLAVFTRSLSAANEFGERLFDRAAAQRFAYFVDRAAVLAQPDGRLALSNGASFAPVSLLKTASVLSKLPATDPSLRRLQGLNDDLLASGRLRGVKRSSTLPKVKRGSSHKIKHRPSSQSDWAEVACLRNNMFAGGDSCIVAHHGIFPQLSVTAFERLLMDGDWWLAVSVDDEPVELSADWTCVCWNSDKDADFMELQQDVAGGVTLSRQVLLSRTDHWLLLSDTVIAAEGTELEVSARLPMVSDVSLVEDRWTRELALRCEKVRARVYPLGLEQERVEKSQGSIFVDSGDVVLTQISRSGALSMPVVTDWAPDRQRRRAQWRQLTVAEDGRRLPPSVACGQRLRLGKEQWLFYRSLRPGQTGRSVLGHHSANETVIAEFTNQGEVQPIIQVESY